MLFKIKPIITCVFAMVGSAIMSATPADKTVVVIGADGSRTEAVLPEVRRIDIGAESLTLHSSTGAQHEVAYADLDRVLIGAEASAIKDIISTDGIAVWPARTSDHVSATGLAEGTIVGAYNAAGVLVASASAGSDGTATLSLGNCASGVYIVSAGKHTVKIIKQ